MIELTTEEVKTLNETRKVPYRYMTNIRKSKDDEANPYEIEFVCSCEQSKGKRQKIKVGYPHSTQSIQCPYCDKTGYYLTTVFSKKFVEEQKKYNSWIKTEAKERVALSDVFYVKKNPDEEYGIIIYNVSCHTNIQTSEESDEIELKTDYAVKNYAIITPGKEFKGYKCLKRSDKEVDLFDAFLINSQNINSNRPIIFEGCTNIYDFFDKNPEFIKRIGIKTALQYSNNHLFEEPFFLLHLTLIGTHPILELLIKMGYTKLYFDVVATARNSCNKAEIKKNIKDLDKLLNNETTKGNMALRIPNYIGNYLNSKGCDIKEYFTWCDIYELEPLSKEQFENYIESNAYLAINLSQSLGRLSNVMKYGYSLEKASNYIYQQSNKGEKVYNRYSWYNNCISNIVATLIDYLDMCDMYGFTPDKYPSDLQTVHDRMVEIKREKEQEALLKSEQEKDETLKSLSNKIAECIGLNNKENLPEIFNRYTVVIPSSVRDFVNEGNAQHNCVGGYYRRVVAQECIIFFVRKTDSPEESFITAEYRCRGGELGQFFYKNNRAVCDSELLEFGKSICSKIKTGIRTGKINWITGEEEA